MITAIIIVSIIIIIFIIFIIALCYASSAADAHLEYDNKRITDCLPDITGNLDAEIDWPVKMDKNE